MFLDTNPVDYNSDITALLGANIATPVQTAPATSTAGGTLPAATTFFYKVTAIGPSGETKGSNEQSVATGAGATNSNTITWGAVTGATGYRIYRGTAAGGENVYYAVGAVTTFTDTGAASTAGTPPATSPVSTATGQSWDMAPTPSLYDKFDAAFYCDQACNCGIQASEDNVNWYLVAVGASTAGTPLVLSSPTFARYMRVLQINNAQVALTSNRVFVSRRKSAIPAL